MSPGGAAIVYLLFAIGAVGVYLALPGRGGRSARIAGLLFGLAAMVGFLILAAGGLLAEEAPGITFCTLAAVALFGAGKVVTHPKPVYSALYFVLVVLAVAGLMFVQAAEFLGIALVIVYAGAILVTYVFVIMLAQQTGASAVDTRAREPLMAVLMGFATMAAVAGQAASQPLRPDAAAPRTQETAQALNASNTAQVGFTLLSQYVVALEIAGVLLLVAMVGAIAMAKKRIPCDVPIAPPPPPGEIGKQVAPF